MASEKKTSTDFKTIGFRTDLLTTKELAKAAGVRKGICQQVIEDLKIEPTHIFLYKGFREAPQWDPALAPTIREHPFSQHVIEYARRKRKKINERRSRRYETLRKKYLRNWKNALPHILEALHEIERHWLATQYTKPRKAGYLRQLHNHVIKRLYNLGYVLEVREWDPDESVLSWYEFVIIYNEKEYSYFLKTHRINFIVDITSKNAIKRRPPDLDQRELKRWKLYNKRTLLQWFLKQSYDLVKHIPTGI